MFQQMAQQNPQMAQMLNNPQFLQTFSNPQTLQAIFQMQSAMQQLQNTGMFPAM